MQEEDDGRRDFFRRIDPLRAESADDVELAFRLQNTTRMDPGLLRYIIDSYAGELYRWIRVLLYYQNAEEPAHEMVYAILYSVFARASTHLEQFHGQSSVLTWLFAIAYQLVRKRSISSRLAYFMPRYSPATAAQSQTLPLGWESLTTLSGRQRAPIILRILFGLELSDIALVLDSQKRDVHLHMVAGIQRLLAASGSPGIDASVLALIDGYWDDNPNALSQFEEHLETCEVCKDALNAISGLEKSLRESLQRHWEVKLLEQFEVEALVDSILGRNRKPQEGLKLPVRLGQVTWMVGILTLFVVLAVVFIRLTPAEKDSPQAQATTTPELPPILDMQPRFDSIQNGLNLALLPQYIAPAFSEDGNWAVFTAIRFDPDLPTDAWLVVSFYNRQANSVRVISSATHPLRLPWVYWDLAPSISGDGQRIVYVSSSSEPITTGNPCQTPDKHPCLDIYMYDRSTGTTKIITQAAGGGAADGDNLAPTISADGQWVAFWSSADNLVAGGTETCQPVSTSISCLYIYLYHVADQKIEQLAYRQVPGDVVFGVDHISLSSDGRFVGFTAVPTGLASLPLKGTNLEASIVSSTNNPNVPPRVPPILQSSEAIVYDQHTGAYELVNRAQGGAAGNGPSSSPVLSADGQYVAFVSSASNLVEGYNNHFSNVFIRDRQTGSVQIVSVDSLGRRGDGDSGLTYWGRGYYSVDLSSDGRYIVFESSATNLAEAQNTGCTSFTGSICNLLYVHDRQTGTTELVSALPNRAFSFFPQVSANGSLVTFMQSSYNCSPTQLVCSNVMLYDRQRKWMTNITRYGEEQPSLPWSYFASLALPWEGWESTALSFSPDGKLLALGGHDSIVRLWHINTDVHAINQANPDITLDTKSNDNFTVVAISQDDSWLAAGTYTGVVYIWDLRGPTLLYTMKDQVDPIRKIEFSKDGSNLVIATMYQTWSWTLASGKMVAENSIGFGQTAVYALDISPVGDLVATARGDGSIWLQNIPSGKLIARLGGQQLSVSALAFSPDGSKLAARSSEGVINVWNLSPSITLLSSIRTYNYVGSLAFSPDNKYLASTGLIGEVSMWTIPDGQTYTLSTSVPNGMVFAASFSPLGNILAAVFENEIVLWGIPPSTASRFFTHVADSPFVNHQTIASSNASDLPDFISENAAVRNLDLEQAATLAAFPVVVPTRLPVGLEFLDATMNSDGSIRLRYVEYGNQSYSTMLYVYEKYIGDQVPPTMTIGAAADISLIVFDTSSGLVDAEYIHGDWLAVSGYFSSDVGTGVVDWQAAYQWDSANHSQRLRWVQDGVFVTIYYQVNQWYKPVLNEPLINQSVFSLATIPTKIDMIQIASGMLWPEKTGASGSAGDSSD